MAEIPINWSRQQQGVREVMLGELPASIAGLFASGTAVNAAATVIASGYAPANGHAATVTVKIEAHDTVTGDALGRIDGLVVKTVAGVTTIVGAAQIVMAVQSDAALAAATVAYSIVGGALVATCTNPPGYVGTIAWTAQFTPLEG
jgi:hypothetical protein